MVWFQFQLEAIKTPRTNMHNFLSFRLLKTSPASILTAKLPQPPIPQSTPVGDDLGKPLSNKRLTISTTSKNDSHQPYPASIDDYRN